MINRKKDNYCNRIIQDAANAYMQDEIAFLKSGDITDIKIHPRVQKLVMQHIQSITNTSSQMLIYAKRIAMVALITCTIGFITCMCIPSIRSAFLNFIETIHENYIDITYMQNSETAYPSNIDSSVFPEIPAAWSSKVVLSNEYEYFCEITGPNNEHITFSQTVFSEGINNTFIDNNPESTENIYLNNTPATLYTYADGTMILLWSDRYAFSMTAYNTSRDTLFALAESVSPK